MEKNYLSKEKKTQKEYEAVLAIQADCFLNQSQKSAIIKQLFEEVKFLNMKLKKDCESFQ